MKTKISLINGCLLGAVIGFAATEPGRCSETTNAGLATFQKFVNGEVPVKEAVMYRELSRTNGAVINREWWRFGHQNDTWFVQRLKPEATNSDKLVPYDSNICGASSAQLWAVGDQNLHLAAKDVASGSVPDTFGGFYRNLMFSTFSLGIPRENSVLKITDAPVKWEGLEFNTIVGSKRGQKGKVLARASITGQLELGDNGLPASAKFPGADQFSSGTVTYEYSSDTVGIPKIFVVKYPDTTFRYEFLSLALGSNDLAKSDGYVPSLFADMARKRIVMLWTNEFPYEQREGKSYPSFDPPAPRLGELAPKLQGTNWLNTTNPLTLDGLRGKVVLLDFWGVGCVPCIEALPHSEALYNKFRNKGLMVIGVCGGWGEEKKAGRILKEKKITFPNLIDADLAIADGKYGSTAWSYVLESSPSYVLIDKSGNLVWKSPIGSEPTESQIEELLESQRGKIAAPQKAKIKKPAQ
jgi:thiol-disulfide isomerase/thioredoxin